MLARAPVLGLAYWRAPQQQQLAKVPALWLALRLIPQLAMWALTGAHLYHSPCLALVASGFHPVPRASRAPGGSASGIHCHSCCR